MTTLRRSIYRTAVTACLLAGLTACATVPAPTGEMDALNAAIAAAATPEAQRYAADELAAARREQASAQAAMTSQDYQQATGWVAMAQADADLARTKGRAMAAQSAVVAKTEDNATLRRRLLDQEPLK
jgi:hypothetical protein